MKFLLTSSLFLTVVSFVYADLGSSAVYKGTFIFKGGYQITGYIETSGYDYFAVVDKDGKGKYTNDDSMLVAVREMSNRPFEITALPGEFTVYNNIYTPKHCHNPDYSRDQFGIVKPTEIHVLGIDSLVAIKFIKAYRNKRAWLTSSLMIQPKWVIDKFDQEKYESSTYYFHTPETMVGYFAFSYNTSVSKDSLQTILSENSNLLWPEQYIINVLGENVPHTVESRDEYIIQYKKYQKAHQAFIYKLSRMQIFLVYTWSTC